MKIDIDNFITNTIAIGDDAKPKQSYEFVIKLGEREYSTIMTRREFEVIDAVIHRMECDPPEDYVSWK